MDVILFGDQTVDCQTFLKKALNRKNCPILSTFLEQVHSALQDELSSLPSNSRRHVPVSSSVKEFTERYYEAEQPDLAVEGVITCLAQFTHFIGYVTNRKYQGVNVANRDADFSRNNRLHT
jgi:hypothetical protein